MKLIRFGQAGHEKPGLVDEDGVFRDLSGIVDDITGEVLTAHGLAKLRALKPSALPVVFGFPRYGAPVARIGKFICVGLNFTDHATESGMAVPEQPVIFMKASTAIVGANDEVVIPRGGEKTDWEVELGVVIGDTARDVPISEALTHVAGYLIVNDISERAFQLEHGGQWVKGKSCDTFGPIGPWLVTRDEVPDPQNLAMALSVNGHPYQNGNSRTMVFGVARLVSYISRYMTLAPGDVISTGTPAGVGLGQRPPVYLRAGDVIEVQIEHLGSQRQRVRAAMPNHRLRPDLSANE
jgi:2,4-diketo-3-deoxy-L-fuconate hydrolase